MADYDGYDAIFVVIYDETKGGLPVVGHAFLYIQDSEGNWYVTEYAGPNKENARIHLDDANMENVNKMSNGDEVLGVDYCYIEGDFSRSYSYAKRHEGENFGGYDLVQNNCAHYCQEMLIRGEFDNTDAEEAFRNYYGMMPREMCSYLKTQLTGNRFQKEFKEQTIISHRIMLLRRLLFGF